MNEKEQNIVIAKACGWTPTQSGWWTMAETGIPSYDFPAFAGLPSYTTDLNAMHEAEKMLDDDQWLEYMLILCDVCKRHSDLGKWTIARALMFATAAQRAEAFLRTLNLWEDGK